MEGKGGCRDGRDGWMEVREGVERWKEWKEWKGWKGMEGLRGWMDGRDREVCVGV